MEILQDFRVSDDPTIVKGKRAKRPRSSARLSSSGDAAACESFNSSTYSSPKSTEEDEDMANCLILLARANSPPPAEENKFTTKKFTEMTNTSAGKVGIYVYECKTCYRNFASFQALGGHRASHKKPKPEPDRNKSSPPKAAAPDDQEENEKRICKLDVDSSFSPNKKCQTNDQIKPKIHECSICGSEFASGQALGGHMRRHRAAAPPIATTNRDGAITDNDTSSHDVVEKSRNMFALDFDLNLPALPEDDKFDQCSPKPQPDMVFSAAALVDCHN